MKSVKKIIFILLVSSLSSLQLQAVVISSIQDGDWLNAATWDLSRVPADGDYVIINYGHTVSLYKPVLLNDVFIEVDGDLALDNTGGGASNFGSLSLNVNSEIVVLDNASISATSADNNNNYIAIYNTDDVNDTDIFSLLEKFFDLTINGTEWSASDGTLVGPLYVNDNSSASGLVPGTLPDGFTPLPIKLLSFEAHATSTGVYINWATAIEENNHYFVIQRSIDAAKYIDITSVPGAGNSQVELSYNFIDASAPTGVVYYRLKQVDIDGKSETFDPIAVSVSSPFETMSQPEMELYPNPIQNGDLHLSLNNWDFSSETNLMVFSITGIMVYQQSVSNLFVNDLIISKSVLGNLSKGTYLLVCTNNHSKITNQFIVQ